MAFSVVFSRHCHSLCKDRLDDDGQLMEQLMTHEMVLLLWCIPKTSESPTYYIYRSGLLVRSLTGLLFTPQSVCSWSSFQNLWIHFVQPVVQNSLHIFSPVSEGQGDVLTPRNHWDQSPICTVGREWIQWDHLEGLMGRGWKRKSIAVKHLPA